MREKYTIILIFIKWQLPPAELLLSNTIFISCFLFSSVHLIQTDLTFSLQCFFCCHHLVNTRLPYWNLYVDSRYSWYYGDKHSTLCQTHAWSDDIQKYLPISMLVVGLGWAKNCHWFLTRITDFSRSYRWKMMIKYNVVYAVLN